MLVYITIIIAVIALVFEFRRQLMMLQQNSYRNDRYSRWLSTSQDSTSAMRLVSGAVLLASLSSLTPAIWISAGLICAVSLTNTIILVRKKYKKPLVMTRRASRILLTMLLLAAIPTVICLFVCQAQGASLIFVVDIILAAFCFSQSFALVANWLLKPVEANINRKYYQDAERILRGMPDLKIIGVTGSYGKTSTKHYLNRILSEKYDVMMTPGSFNTTMGVIRTVREYLKPYNEVFIVEMGAKQPGDIKEICDLVHPEIGIVTAVGEQHLESFKTIENVQRTKFELIDSLPTDGLAVVNNDFPFVANRKVDNVKCIRYAVSECGPAEYIAEDIRYSAHGTSFTVVTPTGEKFGFSTHLVGECNVSNLLAAIIVALRLEVPIEKIRYAVNDIQQVEHRLNMKRTPGGVTIIDDAFNSNPTGSKMALDVLKMMTGGRRIIVTPGMIELGERQEELNAKFGEYIAGAADIAIIVGHYNREAIISGIKSTDTTSLDVHAVNSFSEAQQLLATTLKPGDTILYENDLPDTFK